MAAPSITNSAIAADVTPGTTVDTTITISAGSSRVLVAFPTFFDANDKTQTVSTVVFDPGTENDAFTFEAASNNDATSHRFRAEVWYLILADGITTGDYTVTATATASVNRFVMTIWEMAGADTTDPFGANGAGSGNSDTMSAAVTTTATDSLVGMAGIMSEEVTFTAGSGDTEETEVNASQGSGWSGYTAAATTATYTVSCQSSDTPNNDQWAAIGIEILEAAANGGRTTKNTDPYGLGIASGVSRTFKVGQL
jgi:hypothetical protein